MLRVSEYIEMRTATATISTGANVWTPLRYLLVFVNVSESASNRFLNVRHTLARCDLIPSSTAPVFLTNLGSAMWLVLSIGIPFEAVGCMTSKI